MTMKYNPKIVESFFRQEVGIAPTFEVLFHPTRKWRMDVAWECSKVAIEVMGGVFSGGRHTRGKGYIEDCNKMNEAQILGWIVLQVVPQDLCMMDTVRLVKLAMEMQCQRH